jgi:hypothetical protein
MWESFVALNHGTAALVLGYAAVELPLLFGLKHGRANVGKWLRSPLVAVPATLVAGVGSSVVAAGLQGLGLAAGPTMVAGFGVTAAMGYLAGRLYARSGADPVVHQRGALVIDSPPTEDAPRSAARGRDRTSDRTREPLTLAGVPIPYEDETKHFKIIGTTGTGKSTAIRELLGGALARGDRAIIADPDGGYLARFYDPKRGDLILNPFDSRSRNWDLFAEIKTPYDVEQLARSLIPDQAGGDRSWTGYARTYFTAVARQAHAQGVRDVGELYRLLVVAPGEELRRLVGGTPAQPFLDEQNGRMFDSIRSVTASAVGALNYVANQNAPGVSIREWVSEGAQRRAELTRSGTVGSAGAGGVLFIPYRAGQIAALRSIISAWMRLGIFEAMDQPEGDQHLWFAIDELDALGPIDGLKDALARLRKFGGRGLLGFQSISQVSGSYGRDAETIVENTGNTMILRSSGSERGGTSQFASRLIGQREVLRTTESYSQRATEFFGSTTRSTHIALEYAVLDAEIEQLPDLEGYLKLASRSAWQRVRLQQPERQPETRRESARSERTAAREGPASPARHDDFER